MFHHCYDKSLEGTHNTHAIRFALPFISDFHTKILYVFLAPTTHTLCPAHRTLLHTNFEIPPPLGEWYCPQYSIYFYCLQSRYFRRISQCLPFWVNGNIMSLTTDLRQSKIYHNLLPQALHWPNFSVCTKQPNGNALTIMVQNADISGKPLF